MKDLRNLLKKARPEDRQALAEILDTDGSAPDDIIEGFWMECQSDLGYIFGNKPTWVQIVQQVANKLGVKFRQFETAKEVEIRIAQKVMETVWEKMTPEQREQMEERWRTTAAGFDKGGALAQSASVFGALTAAQVSGFGVYILASTTLGAITGAIGLTLPFAVYATMSSAIAVIIGPVGWIGAGLFAIWKLTGPNYKKLIPGVLFICALRARLEGGFE